MTPESSIKRQVKDYLNTKKCLWWWNLQGLGSKRGLPDIFALYKGKLYGLEIKAPKGQLSGNQSEFLEELRQHGGIPAVVRSYEDVPF